MTTRNLRMAASYYRTVRTTAKGRWYGKRIADVVSELGPAARVQGDLQQLVKPHDIIEYVLHVHEPPVPDLLSDAVIHTEDDFIVVNKPSGIPVHPTVNYFRHSVTEMLQPKYGPLFPCYRLDRATSGVLLLGRTAEFASKVHQIDTRHKKYYALTLSHNVPPNFESAVFTDPIVTFNGKRGYEHFLHSWKQAKPATTNVKLVTRGTQFAILECEPVTGRTHQIRKHLALHGMPIQNDDVYSDSRLYRRLYEVPNQDNFKAVWDRFESQRLEKLTGTTCSECGTPLYESSLKPLYLHCAEYGFDDLVFKAPVDWLNL